MFRTVSLLWCLAPALLHPDLKRPSLAQEAAKAPNAPVLVEFSQMKVRLQPPAPPYPPLAKVAQIQGTVVVLITVDVTGVPMEANALEGPPQLRATAEAYALGWRFDPVLVNGKAVRARFKLTMPFALKDAAAMPPTENTARVFHAMGREARRACAFTTARVLLNLGIQRTPDDASLWHDLGRSYHDQAVDTGDAGHWASDLALAHYRKAIQLNPKHPLAYNNLGLVFTLQENYPEAEAAFRKQIEVAPEAPFAHKNLGRILVEQGRDREAIPFLHRAQALEPRDSRPLVTEGTALLHLGDVPGALEAFARAQERASDQEARNDSAFALAEAGVSLDQARTWAQEAVKDAEAALNRTPDPGNPQARNTLATHLTAYWDTLGWVHFRQGNLKEALSYLQAAATFGGLALEVDHLGQVREALGNRAGAVRAFARALLLPGPAGPTRARLVKLVGQAGVDAALDNARLEVSAERKASLPAPEVPSGTGEFDVVLGPDGAILEARIAQGLQLLRLMETGLKKMRHPFPFPTTGALRVPARVRATVPRDNGPVALRFLDAQEAVATFDLSPLGPLTSVTPALITTEVTRAWADWAGPEAEARGFTPDRIQLYLEACRTQPLEPLAPVHVEWLQNLARAPEPNLSTWALARLLEAGDPKALPAYQSRMYDHLRALSLPQGAKPESLLQDPPHLARTLAVTAGSPFWALFRRHLQEKLGDPMDPATYAAWCYATSPDQLGLVLEQAAHVKPTVGKRNPAPDPWNDPRFWIVVDWAMAWGREAEFKALAEALPEGPAREAFQQIQARAGGLRGFFGFTVPHASGANEASGDAPVRPMEFKNMKVKTAPPAPDYPPEALGRRLMTTVHLALTVSAEGEPLGARLQPGPWLALFGPTAYAYALDWRFEPATVNREPQAARFILTMPFKLKEN